MNIKNLVVRITVILLFITTAGLMYAGKPVTETVQERIKNTIHYPDEAILSGIQGDVTVQFKIDDESEICIVKMISTDKELEKYVKENLNKMRFEDLEIPYNQYFQITLNFKLEE